MGKWGGMGVLGLVGSASGIRYPVPPGVTVMALRRAPPKNGHSFALKNKDFDWKNGVSWGYRAWRTQHLLWLGVHAPL